MKDSFDDEKKERYKSLVLEMIREDKPKTEQLVALMLKRFNLTREQTVQLLMELEKEGKLYFRRKSNSILTDARIYLFSEKATWFWFTVAMALSASIAVVIIPEMTLFAYVRIVLSIPFMLYLPGNALIEALFPDNLPGESGREKIGKIERVALSLGLSAVLTPLVGLILNYTPWGIRLIPITLSLLALTLFFAIAAVLRRLRIELYALPKATENATAQKMD